MRNFSVDVVRCRRSVYCPGHTNEEFPACYARIREQVTLSEACVMKPAAVPCIDTLYTSATCFWQRPFLPHSTKCRRVLKRGRGKFLSKIPQKSELKVNLTSMCWTLFFQNANTRSASTNKTLTLDPRLFS